MGAGKIIQIKPGSLAEELELKIGDKIIEVNEQKLTDIIDFSFAFGDEQIELLVEHEDGEKELISFEKDYDEELGAEFEEAVFDGIRRCANKCYFCFVDQVPPDMRSSLYIKDDDYRLSFLYGNFITMTNMGKADFERIKRYHLAPLFISVHTMNMDLRKKMLGCKNADKLLEQLEELEKADISYHTQIVLCPGINDGVELDFTISELLKRKKYVESLAIVPVGLTRFREGCYPLRQFDSDGARNVIMQVKSWQEKIRKEDGNGFVYLGDEFYLLADMPLPTAEEYDGFPQLDNGIGLVRTFLDEWGSVFDGKGYEKEHTIVVITGTSFAPYIKKCLESLKIKNLKTLLVPVENKLFGSMVNVSGLLAGSDIKYALSELNVPFDGVIVPESALRSGENMFLDDYSLYDLQNELGIKVRSVLRGDALRKLLNYWENDDNQFTVNKYMWQSNASYTKPEEWRLNENE